MTEWRAKLDTYSRRFIEDPAGREIVEAMVRVREPMSALARRALIDAGVSIHTESGGILTIEMRPEALRAVAGLDFVVRIEISRPMSLEVKA